MERMVKGFFFLDYVRMIKSRKDVDWSNYLLDEDMKYLEEKIVDSEWYPMETFERMGVAVLEVIGNGNLDTVKLFGRTYLGRMFSVHHSLIAEDDPRESLIRFQVVKKSFFNFDPIEILVFHPNYAKIEIDYCMTPRAEEAATHQAVGYFERLLELSGAKDVRFIFTAKKWQGADKTILELDWSEVPDSAKVKGVIFLDYVRMVKSNKKVDWGKYLTPADRLILAEPIEEDKWYPCDTFERMGVGILKEVAFGDLDLVEKWGRLYMDYLFETQPNIIAENDPRESLMRFHVFRKSFFNLNPIEIGSLLGNYAKLEIQYGMRRTAEEAAVHQTVGFFLRLLELSGAKQVKRTFAASAWKGDPATIVELSWE